MFWSCLPRLSFADLYTSECSGERPAAKGWFSWLGRGGDSSKPAPVRAKLGESKSSFYFDKDLKRWVNGKVRLENKILGILILTLFTSLRKELRQPLRLLLRHHHLLELKLRPPVKWVVRTLLLLHPDLRQPLHPLLEPILQWASMDPLHLRSRPLAPFGDRPDFPSPSSLLVANQATNPRRQCAPRVHRVSERMPDLAMWMCSISPLPLNYFMIR